MNGILFDEKTKTNEISLRFNFIFFESIAVRYFDQII